MSPGSIKILNERKPFSELPLDQNNKVDRGQH